MLMDRINMLSSLPPPCSWARVESGWTALPLLFHPIFASFRVISCKIFPTGKIFPRHSEFWGNLAPIRLLPSPLSLFLPLSLFFVNNHGEEVYGPRFSRFVFSPGKRRFIHVSPVTQRNPFRELFPPSSVILSRQFLLLTYISFTIFALTVFGARWYLVFFFFSFLCSQKCGKGRKRTSEWKSECLTFAVVWLFFFLSLGSF